MVLALVVASLAGVVNASAATPLTASDRQGIGATLDRFVKDVVLRRDLRDGWELAGPDLRGGTTKSAWIKGTGVTVAAFPARGTSFANAWTGHLVAPGHFVGSMILQPKPGSNADQTAVTLDLRKTGGRWIVDLFYSTAVFRSGSAHRGSCGTSDCAISGPADYGPQGSASGGGGGNISARVGAHSFLLGALVFLGVLLLIPVGIWTHARRRDNRARAAYEAHLGNRS